MVLAWKQPTFIGGADITGYFVDYREVIDGVPGKWHEANIKAISERAYRVRGAKKLFFCFNLQSDSLMSKGLGSCFITCRCLTSRRTRSTSFRCERPTWQVLASRRCPATPSCVRSGPSLFQVWSIKLQLFEVTCLPSHFLSFGNATFT